MSNPSEVRARAQAELDRLCPEGYDREFVMPPWDRQEKVCRSCGASSVPGSWAVVTLVRVVHETRTVRFSFASVCGTCAGNNEKARELARRVFDAQ